MERLKVYPKPCLLFPYRLCLLPDHQKTNQKSAKCDLNIKKHNKSYVLLVNYVIFDHHIKKTLGKARKCCYFSITGENNNPRFLFSTTSRLTKNQNSVESNIPSTLTSNDSMNFFINKITLQLKNNYS